MNDKQSPSSGDESSDFSDIGAEFDFRSDSDFEAGSSISDIAELPTDIEKTYEEFRDNIHNRQISHLNRSNKEPDLKKFANKISNILLTSLKPDNIADPSKIPKICCRICNRNYASDGNLKRHMKNVHYRSEPFQSTTCKERVSSRNPLNRTSVIRTGSLKQLKCATTSDKSVSVSASQPLKLNQSDSPQKLFQCSFCDRKFKYQGNRRSHERSIHVTKLTKVCFPCSRCDKKYNYKQSLARHVLKHHS